MKHSETIKSPVRVGIVAQDPLRFEGLCSFLASESALELVSISMSETSARPDVDVILIWNHWGEPLFEAMVRLNLQKPNIPLVLIGIRWDDKCMLRALEYGAKGCIDEGASTMEFVNALCTAQQGSIWVPRRVLSAFVERNQPQARSKSSLLNQPFTKREREVLQRLIAGRSNKEIGRPLGIEERTVKSHISRLMGKVGVRNRIELTIHAVTHSLVSPE